MHSWGWRTLIPDIIILSPAFVVNIDHECNALLNRLHMLISDTINSAEGSAQST